MEHVIAVVFVLVLVAVLGGVPRVLAWWRDR